MATDPELFETAAKTITELADALKVMEEEASQRTEHIATLLGLIFQMIQDTDMNPEETTITRAKIRGGVIGEGERISVHDLLQEVSTAAGFILARKVDADESPPKDDLH